VCSGPVDRVFPGAAEQLIDERDGVAFELPLKPTRSGLVFPSNCARDMDEADREADREQHERGDDGQAHVSFHECFDNETA